MVARVAVSWLQVVRNVFGSVSMFAVSEWKWKDGLV
jgi:hypothetical protein